MNTTKPCLARILSTLIALALLPSLPAAAAGAPAPADGALRASQARAAELDSAEKARLRESLQRTQQELADLARKVAELSVQLSADEMREALSEGMLTRPVIGVVLDPDPDAGVRIAAVSPLGPAQEAGVRPGDRLLAVGDRALDGASAEARVEQAIALLRKADIGDEIKLRVQRGKSEIDLGVRPRRLPALSTWRNAWPEAQRRAEDMARAATPLTRFRLGELSPLALCAEGEDCLAQALLASGRWHGLRLFPLNPELGRYFGGQRGLLVLDADPGYPLRPGDVLLSVQGELVESTDAAMRLLRGEGGQLRQVLLRRDGREQQVEVEPLEIFSLPALPQLRPAPSVPPTPRAEPAPRAPLH